MTKGLIIACLYIFGWFAFCLYAFTDKEFVDGFKKKLDETFDEAPDIVTYNTVRFIFYIIVIVIMLPWPYWVITGIFKDTKDRLKKKKKKT